MINYPYTDAHQLNLDWILDQMDKDPVSLIGLKSVLDYGAVADGMTDCSSAILDSINDVGYCLFPNGTYYIDTDVVISSMQGIKIVGFPGAEIVENGAKFNISNCTAVEIRNLTFSPGTNIPDANVLLYKCLDSIVDNCTFQKGQNFNLQMVNCGRIICSNSKFLSTNAHAAISLSLDTDQEYTDFGRNGWTLITQCYITHAGLDGIIANNFNVTITDCCIDSCGTANKAAGIYANGKQNLIIRGCRIRQCTGNGIDVVACTRVFISDCITNNNQCAGILIGGCGLVSIQDCASNANGSSPIGTQDSGIVAQDYNNTHCSDLRIGNCFMQSNVHYGYRLHDVINGMINAVYTYGNTLGDSDIIGTVVQAQYS